MSDKHLEKTLLYLTLLSALLHAAAYGLISLIPAQPQTVEKVTMVELQDLPEPPPPPAPPEPKPKPEPKPVPVPLAKLPRLPADLAFPPPPQKGAPSEKQSPKPSAEKNTAPQARSDSNRPESRPGKADSVFRTSEKGGQESASGAKKIELAKLFPSAKKMSNLEENYREKYRGIEQGDTRMMDTNDPLVAVFSRRLLDAANTSLAIQSRYRPLNAKDAIGVLRVTINREGTVEKVEMMDSTKSAPLDQLFIDSIYKTGFVGPLPKNWPHEKLNLIWIGISRAPAMAH